MKKYQRLALLITSVISLTLFLIYREQYNRLHYVLEVFNFFGQPCNMSELMSWTSIYSYHDWGPVPVWQESGDVRIYSAFWTSRQEANVIVLAPNDTEIVRNCYLWFENLEEPVLGKFSYSKIEDHLTVVTDVSLYRCSMSSVSDDNYPYAVSFRVKGKMVLNFHKILLRNNVKDVMNKPFNVTVCVSPTNFEKRKFVEFLSYHKTLGISSYIFYGGGIPHKLSKIISNLSHKLSINVTFFPWNFPLSDNKLVREIIKSDCVLRNRNQSQHVIILELDEYIVPSNTLGNILEDFHVQSQLYGLPVQFICVKDTNPLKPIAIQNFRVDKSRKNVSFLYRISRRDEVISVQQVDKSFASVHKYVPCSDEQLYWSYNDNTILKYSDDFIRSTLVQMLINKQL